MPRGDRTGPMEEGPRTGRGMGYCAGYGEPGYMNPGPGYGFGRGMAWRRRSGALPRRGLFWGRRHGRRHPWGFGPEYYDGPWGPVVPVAEPTAETELEGLKAEAGWLQEQLDLIKARMDVLNKGGNETE